MPTNRKIEQYLSESRLTIENARNPKVQSYIADYGLGPEHLDEGRALLESAESAYDAHKQEYREKAIASGDHREALAAFRARYVRHVKLLRVAFRNDAEARKTLDLQGERPRSQDALLSDAKDLYTTLQARPDLQAIATAVNVTPDDVQAALDAHDEVRDLFRTRKEEKSVAETSTETRDDVLSDLRGWMRDFWDIADVALEPESQLKEMLGRTVQ